MAVIGLLEVSIALICFLFFHFFLNKKPHESFPRNWPFLGMLPGLLVMLPRFYDWTTEIIENSNLTFTWKGPWFARMDMLITADPDNVRYITSSNFTNYPKGSEFKEIFDVLGDGIFNVDAKLWENLRKSLQGILNHQGFQRFSLNTNTDKLKKGLVPLLDRIASEKKVVDIQDVLDRFVFDAMFRVCTGYDLGSLSIEMPVVEFIQAFDDFEEAIVYRHLKPRILWKLQNWVGFGVEKKITRAHATLDRICARYISAKKKEMMTSSGHHSSNGEATDLLTCYMNVDTTKYELLNPFDERFQRDTILTFMTAGRGTGALLSRLLWLLSNHPEALAKIRQEMRTNLPRSDQGSYGPNDLKKLVYLHGALCETLRLYAPVPIERKSPTVPDLLPSGHRVGSNSTILILIYALGRMKAVWGEDASDFRPERWISETGGLKREPPSKFLAFNAGPRICLGKEMAFTQLKLVLIEILQNYDIKVVEGQQVESLVSAILRIKGGLKVSITKRCSV